MGQAVAALLSKGQLCLWGRQRPAQLPAELQHLPWCDSVAEACSSAEVVVVTVPISAMREVVREFGLVARGDQVVLFVARGVEPGFVLPHTIFRQETCVRKIGVLGGPLQAFAPQPGQPTAVVVGSHYTDPALIVRALSEEAATLVYPTRDLTGVEVAAAIGNVTSMAVGMAQALELGDTVRGLLLTRGLAEAARLGRELGAVSQTFASLAGLGALIPHPAQSLDRHILLGQALAQAVPALKSVDPGAANPDLDGPVSAAEAVQLSLQRHFTLPLVEAVDRVVRGQMGAAQALADVMHRGLDFGEEFSRHTTVDVGLRELERWV